MKKEIMTLLLQSVNNSVTVSSHKVVIFIQLF